MEMRDEVLKVKQILSRFIFFVVAIPVSDLDVWKREAYSKIPANKVTVAERNLLIQVNKSASPLIYPLKKKLKITGFKIKGEFKSLPLFPNVLRQGQKGYDDFPLRVGFVIPGSKTLTGVKKMFAPEWIKNLYRQLPKDQGLDHIEFFNITQNPKLVGTSRVHPNANLISETFIESIDSAGPFEIVYKIKEPISVAAVWLSVDGDDTNSKFDVVISQLELEIVE